MVWMMMIWQNIYRGQERAGMRTGGQYGPNCYRRDCCWRFPRTLAPWHTAGSAMKEGSSFGYIQYWNTHAFGSYNDKYRLIHTHSLK